MKKHPTIQRTAIFAGIVLLFSFLVPMFKYSYTGMQVSFPNIEMWWEDEYPIE